MLKVSDLTFDSAFWMRFIVVKAGGKCQNVVILSPTFLDMSLVVASCLVEDCDVLAVRVPSHPLGQCRSDY